MVVVPQVLDLFWSAIEREVDEARPDARRSSGCVASPAGSPSASDACCSGSIHQQLGGQFRLFLSSGAFLPPALQQALGGSRRHRPPGLRRDRDRDRGRARRSTTTAPGRSAGRRRASRCASPPDGEIQFRGRTVFSGYWNAPELTAAAFTEDGWYRTGDLGHLDPAGRLDPERPDQGHDRAAERVQRVSRGHRERAADRRAARCRSSSRPRPAGSRPSSSPSTRRSRADRRRRPGIDAAVKAANATLGPNQRIAGWRLWPGEDFPRTHTLKIKRDPIRRWAAADAPLPVSDGA